MKEVSTDGGPTPVLAGPGHGVARYAGHDRGSCRCRADAAPLGRRAGRSNRRAGDERPRAAPDPSRRQAVGASWRVDGVRALAQPIAARAGLVVEDVTVTPAGRRRVLRLVVDLPEDRLGGVPLDAVAVVSQELSAALDAADAMGASPY